jgi:hypothetical protein
MIAGEMSILTINDIIQIIFHIDLKGMSVVPTHLQGQNQNINVAGRGNSVNLRGSL